MVEHRFGLVVNEIVAVIAVVPSAATIKNIARVTDLGAVAAEPVNVSLRIGINTGVVPGIAVLYPIAHAIGQIKPDAVAVVHPQSVEEIPVPSVHAKTFRLRRFGIRRIRIKDRHAYHVETSEHTIGRIDQERCHAIRWRTKINFGKIKHRQFIRKGQIADATIGHVVDYVPRYAGRIGSRDVRGIICAAAQPDGVAVVRDRLRFHDRGKRGIDRARVRIQAVCRYIPRRGKNVACRPQ